MKYIIDYIVNFFNFIGDLFVGIGRVLFKFVLIVIHAGEFLISIINSLPTIIKVIGKGVKLHEWSCKCNWHDVQLFNG